MSEVYRALQKLEEDKKKENSQPSNGESVSKENGTTSPVTKPGASSARPHQEKSPAAPRPKRNKLIIFVFSITIAGILGLNVAIFITLNRYTAGRSDLIAQLHTFEKLLTGNEQKIDGLAVEIRKSKLDTGQVTRVLNDISGKLAMMERQSNANASEVNALNREKTRMTDRLSKVERELEAMAEQLQRANPVVSESK